MDHLTEQIDPFARILFKGTVADFNGIFNAVAKAKVSCQNELNRTKVEDCWTKILLAKIFRFSKLFYPAAKRRPVLCGYFKLFDGSCGLWSKGSGFLSGI